MIYKNSADIGTHLHRANETLAYSSYFGCINLPIRRTCLPRAYQPSYDNQYQR
jgi:hypothetical protein